MAGVTQTPVFQIISLILSLFLLAVLSTNVYYYTKIQRAGGCAGVTTSNATALLWVNGIFVFLVVLFLIFAIIQMVQMTQVGQRVVSAATDCRYAPLSRRPLS